MYGICSSVCICGGQNLHWDCVPLLLPTLILEVGVLIEPGTCCSVYVRWLAYLRDQRSSCLFPHPSANFFMSAGVPNSSPHACIEPCMKELWYRCICWARAPHDLWITTLFSMVNFCGALHLL